MAIFIDVRPKADIIYENIEVISPAISIRIWASVELAYESPYNTYYYDVAVDSDAGESTTSEGESSDSNGDDKTDSSDTEGAGSEPDQT